MWRPIIMAVLIGSLLYLWFREEPAHEPQTEQVSLRDDVETSEDLAPAQDELEDKENIEVIVGTRD
jgi:hypothetical protein